jgi:hypothetical protein
MDQYTTLLPPKGSSSRMAYMRTAISSLPRAVLVKFVVGLTFLPVDQFSRSLLSNCSRNSPLRPLVLRGSLIGCQSVQVYYHQPFSTSWNTTRCKQQRFFFRSLQAKLPKVAGAPASPAPTLCTVSLSFRGGGDPSTVPWHSFPVV